MVQEMKPLVPAPPAPKLKIIELIIPEAKIPKAIEQIIRIDGQPDIFVPPEQKRVAVGVYKKTRVQIIPVDINKNQGTPQIMEIG